MAGVYNINYSQGTRKVIKCTYTDSEEQPIDLTGYSGRGQIRFLPKDLNPIAILDVSIEGPTGEVTIVIPANSMEGLVLEGKAFNNFTRAAYDVELFTENDEDVIRLLNGIVFISPEVTK